MSTLPVPSPANITLSRSSTAIIRLEIRATGIGRMDFHLKNEDFASLIFGVAEVPASLERHLPKQQSHEIHAELSDFCADGHVNVSISAYGATKAEAETKAKAQMKTAIASLSATIESLGSGVNESSLGMPQIS
jgi:hypothetical protein